MSPLAVKGVVLNKYNVFPFNWLNSHRFGGQKQRTLFSWSRFVSEFFAVLGGGEVCFGRYSVLFW